MPDTIPFGYLCNNITLAHIVKLATIASTVVCVLTACATGTSTSGASDALFARPPYYAGAALLRDTSRIAHIPIQSSSAGGAVGVLLREMNGYLDSLGVSSRIVETRGTPPDVQFGAAGDQPGTRLAARNPSQEWIEGTRTALRAVGAGMTMVVTLEIGQHRLTNAGWQNNKTIELGADYRMRLPWLASVDTPVNVIQLTGVVVDESGNVIRMGAEGLLARESAQPDLTDDDVERLRTLRRDDLIRSPRVWQVGLRNLATQLAAR